MKILLVEDNSSLQSGISFKLNKEGHHVISTDSVEKATAIVGEQSFHMTILDINLPDGSGLEICRLIRRKSPTTYVMFLTVNNMETDVIMGYDTGGDDYLTKTFSISILMSKIGAVARRLDISSSFGELTLDASSRQSMFAVQLCYYHRMNCGYLVFFCETGTSFGKGEAFRGIVGFRW